MGRFQEKKLNQYVQESKKRYETLLRGLVEIPTVSADPAFHKAIQEGAGLAVKVLREFGARAELIRTPGHPIVTATFGEETENPSVLVYNHLDVQPADPSEWSRDPFVLSIQNGRYGGRGCTDDKGPALTALFAAKFAREQGVPLNIRFVWEFEEEIGSPNFDRVIRSRRKSLVADSIMIADTVWVSAHRPAIPYGLRGLVTATLCLETGAREAHSGLAGGAARNPIGELCEVVFRCYDPKTGKVKIPGFYEDVLPLGRKELQGFLGSGFTVHGFKKSNGLKKIRFHETGKVLDAIWSKPTFEVHGIRGGYTGQGVKTVVPARAEAKISMRLAPRQKPGKTFSLLKSFVRKHAPDVKVRCEAKLDPYLASPSGEFLLAARDAMDFGFAKRPVFIREGGSIGAVVSLNRALKAPVVFLGLSLPEHGYHAPNEYFEWKQVKGGIRSFVHYFDRISRIR